jgi:hypothetical protein
MKMKNHKDSMTGLRSAIYDAKVTQAQLAIEAGIRLTCALAASRAWRCGRWTAFTAR